MSESLTIQLNPGEVVAVTEAVHDALVRRVWWSTHPDSPFRHTCPLDAAQEVIDQLINSFFMLRNLLQENEVELHPDFMGMIHLSEEFMDLVARVTLADEWKDVPTHEDHEDEDDCKVCMTFART